MNRTWKVNASLHYIPLFVALTTGEDCVPPSGSDVALRYYKVIKHKYWKNY